MNRTWLAALAALLTLSSLSAPLRAQLKAQPGDWPAWRGPDRTGLSQEKGLLAKWPTGGPTLSWKVSGLGEGFSTPSVAGGRIYLVGTKGGNEVLIALDATTGKRLWDIPFGHKAGGHPGPRSTPTVDGAQVYVLSSDGKLLCASTAGKTLWTKDLKKDFGGQTGRWAYAESPLVDGDVLVCTPGSATAALVALNKKSGEVLWKTAISGLPGKGKGGYATAGYSSPIVAETGGVKQYIQFLSGGVVGVSAKDGKLLWHYDKPANGTANCSTPIFHDGSVFAASGYRTGGGRAKIVFDGGKFKAEQVYFNDQMQNHHGGMVLVDGYVYGTNNRSLLCVNFETGKVAWEARSAGKGSVAYADGHIYHRGENGEMALVKADPKEFQLAGKFTQPERSSERAWPYPVMAGGKLYLRDWDKLFCYDVKAK